MMKLNTKELLFKKEVSELFSDELFVNWLNYKGDIQRGRQILEEMGWQRVEAMNLPQETYKFKGEQ